MTTRFGCLLQRAHPSRITTPLACLPSCPPPRGAYAPPALSFKAGAHGALLLVIPSDAAAAATPAAAEAEALAGAGGLRRMSSARPLAGARAARDPRAWSGA
jgi:hypothetical protein